MSCMAVERPMTSPEVIQYEATITDPKTYSRPWKISMPIYKHVEKNAQLLEFEVRRVRRGPDVP